MKSNLKESLRKIFGQQVPKEHQVKIEPVADWAIDAQKRVIEKRNELRQEKFNGLAKVYNDKLNQLISLYLNYYSENEDENKASFDILNKEWKDLAYKVNSTQKIIKLTVDGLEVAVKSIVESEDFKKQLKKQIETKI